MADHSATTQGQQITERRVPTPSFRLYGGTAPENYERYFVPAIGGPLAVDLVAAASPRAGEHVLDVACGTGVVAKHAAPQVGQAGSIVGLDLNPGMLAVARSTTPADVEIEWHEASADALPFVDSTFDLVLCQMGLQFFPDKPGALREMRRVLVSGGRAFVNVPGPAPPVFCILADELRLHDLPEAAGFVQHVFSLHSALELQDLFENAGFADVAVRHEERDLALGPPAEFLWQYVHSTPLEAALTDLEDETRAALTRAVVSRWEPFVDDGSLSLAVRVALASARAS